MSPVTSASTYYANRPVDLLHGGAQLADLSLSATRARSAVIRAGRGIDLDDLDRLALERMSRILEEAASSMEFFESLGVRGTPPSGALTVRVDATIDAAEAAARDGDLQGGSAVLSALAQAAKDVDPHPVDEAAGSRKALSDFLERLSVVVGKQLGHVGENQLIF